VYGFCGFGYFMWLGWHLVCFKSLRVITRTRSALMYLHPKQNKDMSDVQCSELVDLPVVAPSRLRLGSAVIIEPRQHPALRHSVRSVRQTLGPSWPIYVFHGVGEECEGYARRECAGFEPLEFIALKVSNLDAYTYSVLCAEPQFYWFFPSEYLLVFQTDVELFPFSPYQIEDFLGYDWVGAPWAWSYGSKGNGGLSLRHCEGLYHALVLNPYPHSQRPPEDLFISQLKQMRVAPPELARGFSVESLPHPTPFGVHKFWEHLRGESRRGLLEYAPSLRRLLTLNNQPIEA